MRNNSDLTTRENMNLTENIGLQVNDPKRRRMEEPNDSGPVEKINTED